MPPMVLRRPCAPHPMYPRVKLAKVTDPLLISRAFERASHGDQIAKEKYVDANFVYNAYVTYNHYAGLMWAQGYRDKAIQVLRKAMALPIANEWMAIILRGKSELNLAVFLSQCGDREECKELLANLSRNMIAYLDLYGTSILAKRKKNEHVTGVEDMMLEEMVILTCFVLHHEASLDFRSKSDVYEQCIQACDDYLNNDEHPLRLLVATEHEASDAPTLPYGRPQSGLASLVDPKLTPTGGGLGWMPELAPACHEDMSEAPRVMYRPFTAPSVSFSSTSRRKRQHVARPATAADTRTRCRSSRSTTEIKRMEKVVEKEKMCQLGDQLTQNTPELSIFRQHGLSHMKKTVTRGNLGGEAPKRDNPFVDFENGIHWVTTHQKRPPDMCHAKEEMKRKSREFWRMSKQMGAEDLEKIRSSRNSRLCVDSPNKSLALVTSTLKNSHVDLLCSNPDAFGDAFNIASAKPRGSLYSLATSATYAPFPTDSKKYA